MVLLLLGAMVGRSLLMGCGLLAQAANQGFAVVGEPPKVSDADRIFADIAQRKDKGQRQRGLDELLGRLKAPQAAPAALARDLRLLQRVSDVPFDRAPFLPVVRASLSNPAQEVRTAALDVMPSAGASEADLPAIARLADDPAPQVRQEVGSSLYFSARGKGEAVIFPIIEKLLSDPSDEVKRETLRSLWDHPISPKAEDQIIALSKGAMDGRSGSIGYDAVYYALSTRPVVSVPVARRLIEIMQEPKLGGDVRWRAAWGLGHKASPEAVDMMVGALIGELDETLEPSVRNYAVGGLATHRTPAALAKLREVAEKDENEALRKAAANALK